jgi:LAO/AO transport system kinase
MKTWEQLIKGTLDGNVRSLARFISKVENRDMGWQDAMTQIYPYCGKTKVIGITGAPGAGKSTLTNAVTALLQKMNKSVGIIAVDPSSPFSGGAVLGDRLRMCDVGTLPGVYIRSMATRGMLGGLCQGARDVARILDAFGKDIVLIETVGVGQDEIEVVKTADMVLVVCVPGQGDGIQAIKAGVMEIADIYVVNKADRQGADEVVMDIQGMLELSEKKVPVLKTVASSHKGIQALVDEILLRMNQQTSNDQFRKEQIREELLSLTQQMVFQYIYEQWQNTGFLTQAIQDVLDNKTDPYTLVNHYFEQIKKQEAIKNG